jgi:hypothetical protein
VTAGVTALIQFSARSGFSASGSRVPNRPRIDGIDRIGRRELRVTSRRVLKDFGLGGGRKNLLARLTAQRGLR